MTPKDHHAFLDNLDQALEEAIRRFRALHHVSLAELHEMRAALTKARQAVREAEDEAGEATAKPDMAIAQAPSNQARRA
ncbi:MAG: hypothetical protein Tsb0016_26790 [Sphingomonadales bacterium]